MVIARKVSNTSISCFRQRRRMATNHVSALGLVPDVDSMIYIDIPINHYLSNKPNPEDHPVNEVRCCSETPEHSFSIEQMTKTGWCVRGWNKIQSASRRSLLLQASPYRDDHISVEKSCPSDQSVRSKSRYGNNVIGYETLLTNSAPTQSRFARTYTIWGAVSFT